MIKGDEQGLSSLAGLRVVELGGPITFGGTARPALATVPSLGEHTDEVLEELAASRPDQESISERS